MIAFVLSVVFAAASVQDIRGTSGDSISTNIGRERWDQYLVSATYAHVLECQMQTRRAGINRDGVGDAMLGGERFLKHPHAVAHRDPVARNHISECRLFVSS